MYYTYILKSIKTGKLYIGHTDNPERRLAEHNNGKSKATCKRGLWELIFKKEFNSKSEATVFELKLKKLKSKKYILENLNNLK
jgi:putative endonuclease